MSALVLAACGEEKAPSWKGEWKNSGGDKRVCRKSFTFKGENNFEIQNSRVQGGEQSSGTYKGILRALITNLIMVAVLTNLLL
ncbi:hypothetical protein AB1L16_26355 [Peribacillus frigoritolerans]|uniref:hypothetical protein n=1 Tax=Peribacillus frigoritolerans TaxID=450367 RepID=UPI0039A229DB